MAATSQLSFFWQTGGEIEWADAAAFALHDEGRKVLMSGSGTALAIFSSIVVAAWLAKGILHRAVGGLVAVADSQARSRASPMTRLAAAHMVCVADPASLTWPCSLALAPPPVTALVAAKLRRNNGPSKGTDQNSLLPMSEIYPHDADSDYDDDASSDRTLPVGGNPQPERPVTWRRLVPWLLASAALLAFAASALVLDPDRPYGRVLTTLPLPLLDIFKPSPVTCSSGTWPLPDLIDKSKWETPHAHFKGWAPGSDNPIVRQYRDRRPAWLPASLPPGFARWDTRARRNATAAAQPFPTASDAPPSATPPTRPGQCPGDATAVDPFYNPANDPMKISNLDADVLHPLQRALASGVNIRHVALIQMESMREELFPLEYASAFHRLLMKSHDEADVDEANAKFSRLTVNMEKLTGRAGGFRNATGEALTAASAEWDDKTAPGFGGINIVGAHTASSVSTKSTAAIHCGVWPLPVDMFEESMLPNYQPCLPQVLELFNRFKANVTSADFRSHKWYPAFFQSVTDAYDRQDKWDDRVGFKYIVTKPRLKKDFADDPSVEEINYFGYPETALKQYLRDYITNVTANNQRMFLSHFTSTTHHPWSTPSSFNTTDYMGAANGGLTDTHKDMNKYLNTVRWTDAWLGDLMQMFDDLGVANETLVVFVGDHGQAFQEDFKKTGTYENGHVSNFRVPVTFYHPMIPRVQHRVNTTSMSILPTILDLLITTGSLGARDAFAASDLIQDYEGQSLIRPYRALYRGRRAWNFGVVNPGGRMLTVSSADAPWRLVMPLDGKTEFVFTDLGSDPLELERRTAWSIRGLVSDVRRQYGDEASKWLQEADLVTQWWRAERKRLWQWQEPE